jgi:hypothetical protein
VVGGSGSNHFVREHPNLLLIKLEETMAEIRLHLLELGQQLGEETCVT